MSDSSIMSVRELIDTAFGDPATCQVNFKLVQAVLFLLARQLRVLERRVGVEIGFLPFGSSSSTLSVTEVKISAKVPKKTKKKPHGTKPSASRTADLLSKMLTATPKMVPIKKKTDQETSKAHGTKAEEEDENYTEEATLREHSTMPTADRKEAGQASRTINKTAAETSRSGKAQTGKSDRAEDEYYDKRGKPSSEKKSKSGKTYDDGPDDEYDEKSTTSKRSAGKLKTIKKYDDEPDEEYDEKSTTSKKSTKISKSGEKYDDEPDEDYDRKSTASKKSEKRSKSDRADELESDEEYGAKTAGRKKAAKKSADEPESDEDYDKKSVSSKMSAKKQKSDKKYVGELELDEDDKKSIASKKSVAKPATEKDYSDADKSASDKKSFKKGDKKYDEEEPDQGHDKKSITSKRSVKKSGQKEDVESLPSDDYEKSASDKKSADKKYSEKSETDKDFAEKSPSSKKKTGKKYDESEADTEDVGKSPKDKKAGKKYDEEEEAGEYDEKSSSGKKAAGKRYDDESEADKVKKSSTSRKSGGKSTSDKRYDDEEEETEGLPSSKKSGGKSAPTKKQDDKSKQEKDFYGEKESSETASERSGDKSQGGKAGKEKSGAERSKAEKSSDKDRYGAERGKAGTSDKASKSDKGSTKSGKGISVKGTSGPDDSGSKKKYLRLLEKIEEERERVLRVIHQRADSHEEGVTSPTPIASMESTEIKYEKLLIVERIPTEEAKARKSDVRSRTPRLSVVTLEQFEKLVRQVMELESKFGPIGVPGFPENIRLMEELRKSASLTDAMAALQLSARLEATEKAIEKMVSLITDLASRTPKAADLAETGSIGTELLTGKGGAAVAKEMASGKVATDKGGGAGAGGKGAPGKDGGYDQLKEAESETQVLFGRLDTESQGQAAKSTASKKSSPRSKTADGEPSSVTLTEMSTSMATSLGQAEPEDGTAAASTDQFKKRAHFVSYEDLDSAMRELYDEFNKALSSVTTRSNANAENAIKIATRAESKIDQSMNLGTRMEELEAAVADYVDQINTLDTGLSSQMTNYQEQLTQMQHDLETGLENMAEALANTGGDNEAVAELNGHFTSLQMDFDRTKVLQKDLEEVQKALAVDLQDLWKEIEVLRDSKADRDEVADALRDKAGIGVLNGMVTLHQFDAVRGDFEKRISQAYDKFNNQEIIWQKAIDDLLREINEKADYVQVMALRDDVNKNLEMLKGRINWMLDLLGEPRAAAVTKRLFRDAACLSCSTPAHMTLEEPTLPMLSKLPSRPPAVGEEAPAKHKDGSLKDAGDGDHRPCYPGLPIPHPIDPRSHICARWCGGSHTIVPSGGIQRAPVSVNINQLVRETTTAVGTDGKTYMADKPTKVPCAPCNVPLNKPTPIKKPITYQKWGQSRDGSSMVPTIVTPAEPMNPSLTAVPLDEN